MPLPPPPSRRQLLYAKIGVRFRTNENINLGTLDIPEQTSDTRVLELEHFAGGSLRVFLFGLQRLVDQPHDAIHGGRPRGGLPRFDCLFVRSEEHTSELQSRRDLVCRLLLEKKKERK